MSRHQPLSSKNQTQEHVTLRDLRPMAANEIPESNFENIAQMPLLPGQKLKQARERQGLSLAEIADQLRLSKDYIAAIENDAFDRLPGATFTRGYIRSYANLVKANGDEIVALFDASMTEGEEEKEVTLTRTPGGNKSKVQPWLSYLVVVVISLLAISWWWTRDDASGLDKLETVEVQTNTGELIVESMNVETTTESAVTVTQESTAEPSGVNAQPESTAELSSAVINGEVSLAETAPDTVVEPDSDQAVETPAAQSSLLASEAPVVSEESLSQNLDQLTITFLDDCWVQIKDADGKTLHADLERANETVSVSGVAPLKVKFGNWRAVGQLQFNEKQIPIPQSQRGDVVQFTVDP